MATMNSAAASGTSAVTILPVLQRAGAVAHLFDGCPNEEFIIEGVTPRPLAANAFERVLEATVAVNEEGEAGALLGAAIAQGCARIRRVATVDAQYLEVQLSWPQVHAWGEGHCDFLKERARARCLELFSAAALDLVHQVEGVAPGVCAVLSYEGAWDEETEPLRRKLAGRFVRGLFDSATLPH